MTEKSTVQFSIDLVEAALKHRQFLQLIDAYPRLYAGRHVHNAIRRYELFWLPLVAQSSVTTDIAAPLDIAWVWHVHMLSPISYEKDCNEVVSTLIDHKILVGEQRTRGLQRARHLWKEFYPREPFEVDLTASVSYTPDFQSRIEYDITAACGRQRVFYYQISLPHYGDKKFLTKALERYKQHLVLKQKNPDLFFVPCYDFDLIWHAHQVHPLIYQKDTTEVLGKVLNHNDSVNDRRPGSKLSRSCETTREKWKEAGQEFEVSGVMFRGEPPLSTGIQAKPVDYTGMAATECTVELSLLEVQGLPESKSYAIKIDVVNGEHVLKTRVRGPAASLSSVRSTFKFTQTKSRCLKVRIYRHESYSLFSQTFDKFAVIWNHLLGCSDLLKHVSARQPVTHKLAIADGVFVRFTTAIRSPTPYKYYFRVKPENNFSPVQHPAQILSSPTLILSPLSLAQSSAPCSMSVHQLFDFNEREAFTCRVMHSAQLLFSSVEVINHAGSVVSTAHVIRGDVIPTREQVSNAEKCCTMDEMAGERAILIRGSQDWGICVGKWKGFVEGVTGVPGTKGKPGRLSIKFFSLFGKREWKYVKKGRRDKFSIGLVGRRRKVHVDLRKGEIYFSPEVRDIPEAIALGFSIAILHLLCQPYYLGGKYMKPSEAVSCNPNYSKPRRIRNKDLKLVVAAGFYADNVPTNAYIKYNTGGGASGGCGVCGGCGGGFSLPGGVSSGGDDSFGESGGCGGCGGCGCGGCGD